MWNSGCVASPWQRCNWLLLYNAAAVACHWTIQIWSNFHTPLWCCDHFETYANDLNYYMQIISTGKSFSFFFFFFSSDRFCSLFPSSGHSPFWLSSLRLFFAVFFSYFILIFFVAVFFLSLCRLLCLFVWWKSAYLVTKWTWIHSL